MKVILTADSKVLAVHSDNQDVATAYPGCICVQLPDAGVEVGQELAVDLSVARSAASAQIDAEAERLRQLVLTPGSGQALEYQYTSAEALKAVAAVEPLSAKDYPLLAAEQTALSSTVGEVSLLDVAKAVIADCDAWVAYGAAIKAIRRKAKLEIAAAANLGEILSILAGVVWP